MLRAAALEAPARPVPLVALAATPSVCSTATVLVVASTAVAVVPPAPSLMTTAG